MNLERANRDLPAFRELITRYIICCSRVISSPPHFIIISMRTKLNRIKLNVSQPPGPPIYTSMFAESRRRLLYRTKSDAFLLRLETCPNTKVDRFRKTTHSLRRCRWLALVYLYALYSTVYLNIYKNRRARWTNDGLKYRIPQRCRNWVAEDYARIKTGLAGCERWGKHKFRKQPEVYARTQTNYLQVRRMHPD